MNSQRLIRQLGPALLPVAVGVLAFACRLYVPLGGGGLKGQAGYDDGVYFAGADALVAGRVPYRDFVVLHPPGLIYLLTPFALLGHAIGDANGWAVARVAMMVVGSVSAALVVIICRRFGVVAAVTGGVLYAVWTPAITGEFSTLLEGVPNLLLLGALLILVSPNHIERRRFQLLAGALLGLAMSIKIWGLAPLALVVVWLLLTAGWRRAATVLGGSVLATVVVCLPTFVLAPGRMWLYVVRGQLNRTARGAGLQVRAANFTPMRLLFPHASATELRHLLFVTALIGVVLAFLALQVPGARLFVAVMLVTGAVIVASPVYYPHYGALIAPGIALTVGVGAQRLIDLAGRYVPVLRIPLMVGIACGLVTLAIPVHRMKIMLPYPGAQVTQLLKDKRCVAADSPGALTLGNALTRNLQRGCPTRIDVTGVTYNTSASFQNGQNIARSRNLIWQKDLLTYLTTADAFVLARSGPDGLSADTQTKINQNQLLLHKNGIFVYAVSNHG